MSELFRKSIIEIEFKFDDQARFYYFANMLPFKLVGTNIWVSAFERDNIIKVYLKSEEDLKRLFKALNELVRRGD